MKSGLDEFMKINNLYHYHDELLKGKEIAVKWEVEDSRLLTRTERPGFILAPGRCTRL
jgi:hypothetical protein